MSELLLDRDISQEQFDQEFALMAASYGAPAISHEVCLGREDDDRPDKEDTGNGGKEHPILEPGPSRREGEDSFLRAGFGIISMSNSGGRPRPGEGGPIPPPQPKAPKTPPPPPRPHP